MRKAFLLIGAGSLLAICVVAAVTCAWSFQSSVKLTVRDQRAIKMYQDARFVILDVYNHVEASPAEKAALSQVDKFQVRPESLDAFNEAYDASDEMYDFDITQGIDRPTLVVPIDYPGVYPPVASARAIMREMAFLAALKAGQDTPSAYQFGLLAQDQFVLRTNDPKLGYLDQVKAEKRDNLNTAIW